MRCPSCGVWLPEHESWIVGHGPREPVCEPCANMLQARIAHRMHTPFIVLDVANKATLERDDNRTR